MIPFTRERIERAARIYRRSADAAIALGIAEGSFQRLCVKFGVDTPKQRKVQQRASQELRED